MSHWTTTTLSAHGNRTGTKIICQQTRQMSEQSVREGTIAMSAVAEHMHKHQHLIKWGETIILDQARGHWELLLKEAVHIWRVPSQEHFNHDEGMELMVCSYQRSSLNPCKTCFLCYHYQHLANIWQHGNIILTWNLNANLCLCSNHCFSICIIHWFAFFNQTLLSGPLSVSVQDNSRPLWYIACAPMIMHTIESPCLKSKEQMQNLACGTWPQLDHLFDCHCVNIFCIFLASCSQCTLCTTGLIDQFLRNEMDFAKTKLWISSCKGQSRNIRIRPCKNVHGNCLHMATSIEFLHGMCRQR